MRRRRNFHDSKDGGFCVSLIFILTTLFWMPALSAGAGSGPQQTGAVALSQGIADLASELAKGIPEGHTMTIAVTDFPDRRKEVCGLGQFVAERLSTLLSRHPQCRLIERRRLDVVLGELKFSMSELVDPAKARRLGEMLGVQGLVVGTITDLGATFDVDARIIDIQTDVSLPGAAASVVKDEAARQLSGDCGGTRSVVEPSLASGGLKETAGLERTRGAKSAIQKVTVKDFTFEVRSCTLTATRVNCLVAITNGGPDRQVSISTGNISMPAPTRIIDDSGNEYTAETVQLGNRSSSYNVAASLPTGVPVAANLVFENVPEGTSTISLLEIPFYVVDREMLKAQVRKIPVIR
jgi:TolB-like protein